MSRVVDHVGEDGAVAGRVRGALLVSSLRTLRDFGYLDRYLDMVPERHHEDILFCRPEAWLPMDVAAAHYRACDCIGLTDEQMAAVGEKVAQRLIASLLGSVLRRVRLLGGPTPWLPLKRYGRICEHLFGGGHHRVESRGPKDAIVQSAGVVLYGFRYFRTAHMGMVKGSAGLFARTCHVRPLEAESDDCGRVLLRWV